MANEEQLALLKRSVEEWNKWREENPLLEIDLREADLRGANLRRANLYKADLSKAMLGQDNLDHTRLTKRRPQVAILLKDLENKGEPIEFKHVLALLGKTDLSEANLAEANLVEADLARASLYNADLAKANLSRACLARADLWKVNLCEADLTGADLRGAHLPEANLEGAKLPDANLEEADLNGTNLKEVDLGKANLRAAKLRAAKLAEANLVGANLIGADLMGANLDGANLVDATMSRACLNSARLVDSDLRRAKLEEANLIGADLYRADLSRANLAYAVLDNADLTRTNLSGAILIGANLSGATLVNTRVDKARLSGCVVYGINVWDLKGEFEEQKDLVITPLGAPKITVDNIKIAQFIYLILDNEDIRDVINTLTSKSVLILGRFSIPERKHILDALKLKLREYNLLPIVFDFERPVDKDFTETIKTLAGLAYFVIADITNPKSSPLELQATVPDYQVPFVPIIQEGEQPFAMMADLQKKYNWVLDTLSYDSIDTLIAVLKSGIIDPAIAKHNELRLTKAREPIIRSAKDFLDKSSK